MDNSALFWLLLNLTSTLILSFYSMMEMACVSFNKVRLQYYVSKGIKQAVWLNYLLHNPSRLFGTTLILVNAMTIMGSECGRQFYEAMGLNPDLAPITQVLLVVIFGELAPMFAARRYPEHVAMLGAPLVYASAKLMTPFLILLGFIARACNYLIKGQETEAKIFLSQEELLKILETQDEDKSYESDEFNAVATNILKLRKKNAKDVMNPLNQVKMVPSNATIAQVRMIIENSHENYIPMYHKERTNIVGIGSPHDLLRASSNRKAREYFRSPWFIAQSTSASQILYQFRFNNESVGIVINEKGLTIGVITLDAVVEEIFGEKQASRKEAQTLLLLERTYPGDMLVSEFNKQYDVVLDPRPDITLSDLVIEHLGHHAEEGEAIYINPFEITVKDASLLEIKSVSISTKLQ